MYIFRPSTQFKKDIKKVYPEKQKAFKKLQEVFSANHQSSKKFNHHKLHGKLKDCCACHLKSDLVLIYQRDKEDKIIYLLRLGSHSELF